MGSPQMLLLSFQSLGVVYGHLSIGPLYVFRTVDPEDIASEETFYGLLSLVFWTMTLIPLVKYVFIVLRVDDNGEGGTFALYSLLCRHAKVGLLPNTRDDDEEVLTFENERFCSKKLETRTKRALERNKFSHYLILFLALLGSCMVIGIGILVPVISVSSVSLYLDKSLKSIFFRSQEHRQEEFLKYAPVPTACAILVGLFVLQHYGTHRIGFLLAPIVVLWLLFISGVGIYNVFHWNHHILYALSPEYLYKFMRDMDTKSWKPLSAVLLCIAGSEAMFADLGHFSKKSIKIAFILLVYPSLILSYMGQTAYISKHWNPLNASDVTHLAESIPENLQHLYALLSLLASAVGSQATITATFSIINQCLALGCFPRVKVVHTSNKIHGQVYIPDINWILMILCVALTIASKDAVHVGNAIGLATITSMLITTCFMALIIALCQEKVSVAACFLIFFGSVETVYFISSLRNFQKGAWLLIFFVELVLMIMLAWQYGTRKKYEFDVDNKVSIEWLTSLGLFLGASRVPGIGFVHTDIMTGIPAFFSNFVTNLPAIHQVLIFVSFRSIPAPNVPQQMRYVVGRLGSKEHRAYRCIVRYGYHDNIGDMNEFEDEIISAIGKFISSEDRYSEIIPSPEGKMIAIGNLKQEDSALITMHASDLAADITTMMDSKSPTINSEQLQVKRKKVRFALPPKSPDMCLSVREELQELVDARELGITYILGRSHYFANKGSGLWKRVMIKMYIFLANNCRETSVVLSIQQAAFIQVGMAYSI